MSRGFKIDARHCLILMLIYSVRTVGSAVLAQKQNNNTGTRALQVPNLAARYFYSNASLK